MTFTTPDKAISDLVHVQTAVQWPQVVEDILRTHTLNLFVYLSLTHIDPNTYIMISLLSCVPQGSRAVYLYLCEHEKDKEKVTGKG